MNFLLACTFLLASLTNEQALQIGVRVWQNEASGTTKGLICWNQGEDFASLGIGHFIWYPQGKKGPFVETFPALLEFFISKGVSLPRWLQVAKECPWKTRRQFLSALQGKQIAELKALLKETIILQAEFLALRLEKTIPEMLECASPEIRQHIAAQLDRIKASPQGLYVLIDYINFKGSGLSEKERYCGFGWGLLQVLEIMSSDTTLDPIEEFSHAATLVLKRRVQHAPTGRNEQQWLPGWLGRIRTYTASKEAQ